MPGCVENGGVIHTSLMDKILQTLRAQSWERAKAELASIQQADYAPELGIHGSKLAYENWRDKCAKRRVLIQNFILAMEEDELYR